MFDMFRNIIKNFFDGPSTRLYPFVKRKPFANVRGQISGIDADLCIFCGICQRRCPALAIVVDKPTKTWTINQYKCVICGVCVEACPKKCISMDLQYKAPVAHKELLAITQQPKTDA
jgi:formate hydrogenlyase subunit 6/NADH:ubiquinone oxidoreductase subunit I